MQFSDPTESSKPLRFPCRTLQDAKNLIASSYPLPPQPGAALDHQTLFNSYTVGNCSTNQGKRRREDNMNQIMCNMHQQSHSNQLIDASQIQSRNVDVSTGLRLAFNDHQLQQQHSFDPQSSGLISNFINQQGDEIEHYLLAQGEEFRRTLADKRQRHYHALIGAVKESASRILREKEAVAEKAARRNAELEARAAQLSAESQVWQAKAAAQEAVAAALQAELQQAVVAGGGRCVTEAAAAEDAESTYIDPERVVVVSGPGCKACGKRVASVVLLPCRHLCVCSECDDVVQTCPLCLSFRSSSIEVYLS